MRSTRASASDDRRRSHVGEGDVAVAGVEGQVQHGQNPVQPLLQQLGRRNPVRDARVIDLAARPHQPLRHRGLRDEERSCDLGHRETGDGAQRQCHAGCERQGRMAAREDQAQPIVVDVRLPRSARAPCSAPAASIVRFASSAACRSPGCAPWWSARLRVGPGCRRAASARGRPRTHPGWRPRRASNRRYAGSVPRRCGPSQTGGRPRSLR